MNMYLLTEVIKLMLNNIAGSHSTQTVSAVL
jgi:hypothetical protein